MATGMSARQQRLDEATTGPWRVVTLPDGSHNVYGGPDGAHFLCTTGHGDGARQDAQHIVVALTTCAKPSRASLTGED